MINTSYETIVAVLNATGGMVMDDHFSNNVALREIKMAAIAEIEGTVIGIVTPEDGFPTMGLNKLYVGEDHRVHVSKVGISILDIPKGDIKNAVDNYNSIIVNTPCMRKYLHKRQISNLMFF